VSRRRRPNSRRPQTRFPLPPFSRHDSDRELVLAQVERVSCDECGATQLLWGDVGGGIFEARTAVQRQAFREALEAGMGPDWAAWWCAHCDAVGIFVPHLLFG